MGFSIPAQALVLLLLLVALVALVLGQVVAKRRWPVSASSTGSGGTRWEMVVWAASAAAFGGLLVGLLVLVPLRLMLGFVPDAVWGPWMFMWALGPCAILGYLSGRWWAFVGASPLLVLWPVGVVFSESTTDATVNADLFSTLPVTAVVAVALALGSAARVWQNRRPAREHRGGPAPSVTPGVRVAQRPVALQEDITPTA